ncbi:MAG: bifunctional helix-turn-helix domain-containing protein/methylated-DNA--[protein]-cysteine S-methyltransferase [Gammaproteobacteria bacterium]|nr:bifunctional helix-turn-helix domain-containing protein/methylated-DNA--[protein]-cysteine S-methyltransferase [Gammaproteobacteria bacterium]MBV9724712.1 bifunctional helix-turn-helix domain-containing protein/methylated-DNA--[protein]-cysteine S-methyltransferase [Gammaproteobacteria bacterium]
MNSTQPHQGTAFLDSRDFARVARAITYVDEHFREQPRLATIAAAARLSEFHFNRLFRRWAGVTPRQYLAFVTANAARRALAGPASVLDAAYAVGLSGPGRLHDLLVTLDAATPGEVKTGGLGLHMSYGFAPTPFGTALLASTARGVTHLAFIEAGGEAAAVLELTGRWPCAHGHRDDEAAAQLSRRIWGRPEPGAPTGVLKLSARGTNFQIKVWRALLELGSAGHTTYAALADAVGVRGAAQAVGNAVGANPIAWLIPCHTVLRKDRRLGGYRWGAERKRAMLAWSSLRALEPGTPRSGSERAAGAG